MRFVILFFSGVFLSNGVPHFIKGVCGERFKTPFIRITKTLTSSAFVNVIWGMVNGAIGISLLALHFVHSNTPFELSYILVFLLGFALMSISTAHLFKDGVGTGKPNE